MTVLAPPAPPPSPPIPAGGAPGYELDGDRIVATLHELGVRYIVCETGAEPYENVDPAQLIAAMIGDESPRVEYAVISLLIRHTEFAPLAQGLAASLPQDQAELLKRHYTAAVYLQRMYRPALEIYLGKMPALPDYFSAEMGLPSPDEYYGVVGLRELVDRLPPPINWWDSYLYPVRMLIRFMSLEKTYAPQAN